ncbi:MAG: hypothetical protein ACLTYN_03555 [Dysosmobacter welbionis]
MHPILPKKDMTEEDIKLQYITPAVTSKWSRGKITMETQITDGKINLRNMASGRNQSGQIISCISVPTTPLR